MTDTKNTYKFTVPCAYYYEIEANTEEEAREILLEKGGIEIDGELLLEDDAYRKADCIDI
tara:strand:+ start:373 stop:552 length:180 start_codon:yes stop_codon:yes gene_type:complete